MSASLSHVPFSEIVSYIENTVRFSCHSLHSFLQSLDLLNDIFKSAYIKIHSVPLSFIGLDKCIVSCIHNYSITQTSFTTLANPLLHLLNTLHLPALPSPKALTNTDLSNIYSLAFSRILMNWNPIMCRLSRLVSFTQEACI